MTIRRFKIHLSSATFNLTDGLEHTYFFESPSGLGLNTDYTYEKLGDAYVRVGDSVPQRTVSGTLIVRGESRQSVYENYQTFVNALSKDNNACKLEYSLPNGSIYMIDADIVQIEKFEMYYVNRCKIKVV